MGVNSVATTVPARPRRQRSYVRAETRLTVERPEEAGGPQAGKDPDKVAPADVGVEARLLGRPVVLSRKTIVATIACVLARVEERASLVAVGRHDRYGECGVAKMICSLCCSLCRC
jgi:hypothetical protein